MTNVTDVSSRKTDHIRINLDENVTSGIKTGLEKLRFTHQALPEINLEDIETSQQLFGKQVRFPLLISSMTGGSANAKPINQILAAAAQEFGLVMGLGSMRAAIEKPDTVDTYQVRKFAPDILLFANLGAVQLNYEYGVEHCKRVVDLAQADALVFHLNPLQEALQPEGDTRFANLLSKIEKVCHDLPIPVIVKEVGWGISGDTAHKLVDAGVSAIDVAGAGGTSWSQVEMHRIKDPIAARVAGSFIDWGIPTVESLRHVHNSVPQIPVFASGGLQTGIDIAKCIALGATLGGMAGPMLRAAVKGQSTLLDEIRKIQHELTICMFVTGANNLSALHYAPLVEI